MNQNDNKNTPEELDVSQAMSFLSILDEDNDKFTFITIEEPKPTKRQAAIQQYIGTFEEHRKSLIQANLNGSGVFVTINATDGTGRKKDNVTRVRALFVDLDGSPLEPVHQSPIEPHILIESSPNRYHAYWLIEGMPLEHFESAQKRLAQHFEGDPCVCDLPRLMRLPGFLHRKNTPFQSQILETSNTQPYIFKEFQKAFGWHLNEAPLPKSQPVDTDTLHKLRERGLIKQLADEKEGRWLLQCPWAEEHTNGDDAYYFSKPSTTYSSEGFKCFHSHCKHRDIRALRFFLGLTPTEGVEPLPLFREVPPPLIFPIDALGPILGQAAKELYTTIQAPLAVIAQSLLGAASLVAQGHANVEIDGRSIALSLSLITVAESGERKSAVDDVVLSAVLEWQSSLWAVYRTERSAYEEKLEEWQNAKKRRGTSYDSTEILPEPEPPIMPSSSSKNLRMRVW